MYCGWKNITFLIILGFVLLLIVWFLSLLGFIALFYRGGGVVVCGLPPNKPSNKRLPPTCYCPVFQPLLAGKVGVKCNLPRLQSAEPQTLLGGDTGHSLDKMERMTEDESSY